MSQQQNGIQSDMHTGPVAGNTGVQPGCQKDMQAILSPQPPRDSQKDLPPDLQDKVDGIMGKLAGVRAMLETSK